MTREKTKMGIMPVISPGRSLRIKRENLFSRQEFKDKTGEPEPN